MNLLVLFCIGGAIQDGPRNSMTAKPIDQRPIVKLRDSISVATQYLVDWLPEEARVVLLANKKCGKPLACVPRPSPSLLLPPSNYAEASLPRTVE